MSVRNILVLGSGLVARPCVEYLARNPSNHITIACRSLATAQTLASSLPRTNAISLDVASSELDAQVQVHDLVISLVPYAYHPTVIKSAIKYKKDVVTTSYISSAMRELEEEVKAAGIVVVNEVGVDPGVDHLYAIELIEEVHEKGGKIREFYSFCGGIPAPEHADNPLRFKFSWSPRGALLSQQNSARFLEKGKIVEIKAEDLMGSAKPYFVQDGYDFVAYPNRDSVPFQQYYNIPEAETVVRGSLRYEGNPAFVKALFQLGWLKTDKVTLPSGLSWAEVNQHIIGAGNSDEQSLISRINELCKLEDNKESERIVSGLRWIGFLGSDTAMVVGETALDILANRLETLLSYQPGERDLVMLQHKFVIDWPSGRSETITSTLELYGEPFGYSGMAKSVGMTCGVATQLVLDRHPGFDIPGIYAPYTKAICDPIREGIEKEGIKMIERNV